jgi:YggT family protein
VTFVLAASARQEVADFVSALFFVYTLVIVAWIVVSLVLSLGLTPPYNRVVRGVLDFLHDTSEPFLRIFRRLGLRIGPLDLSPIVALLVLRIAGGLIVSAID